MYHRFHRRKKYNKDKYSVDLRSFEKTIKYFKRKGFEFVRLKDLWKSKNNAVCLTFDDSHFSQYEAFKIMKKDGVKGTFFVITSVLNSKDSLSIAQIKEMLSSGMEIGSHTTSHKDLTDMNENELAKELYLSKKRLESMLNIKIESISIPGGEYNQNVIKSCLKFGYKFIRTSDIGFVEDEKIVYPALPIRDNFLFKIPEFFTSGKVIGFMSYLKGISKVSEKKDIPKSYLKGIFHVHSNYSRDSKLSLEDIRDFCLSKNLNFAILSEHAEDMNKKSWKEYKEKCDRLSDKKFVLIPGLEIPCKEDHIILVNPKNYFFSNSVEKVIDYCKKNKIFCIVAHVSFKSSKPRDVDLVEIWNKKYHGFAPLVNNLIWFRKVMRNCIFSYAIGGNDIHKISDLKSAISLGLTDKINYKNVESFKKDVVKALKEGRFCSYNNEFVLYPEGMVNGKALHLYVNEMLGSAKDIGRKLIHSFHRISL